MNTTWRVPGRLEVLGKHTDYAGGRVLVCAIDRAVTAHAESRHAGDEHDEGIRASSDAAAGELTIVPGRGQELPPGHWGRYVQTVADRLERNFGPLRPARLRVRSTLPLASGMSSSSALLVASALALADLNGFSGTPLWAEHAGRDRLQLAGYLATVENGRSWGPLTGNAGVGTHGGSEDHAAMLCGAADTLTSFEFDPMREVTRVAFPSDLAFVVAVSGVPAEKSGAARQAYNRASTAAGEVLRRWNEATGRADVSLAAAIRADPDGGALRDLVADEPALSDRLEHFVAESRRLVPGAVEALAAGDLDAFGALCDESQHLAERLLDNQVPETAGLARTARSLGARAASAFGAGFGGSVWALVPAGDADDFARAWLARYRKDFPDRVDATTLTTRPGPPAAAVRHDADTSDADQGENGRTTCGYS